MVTQVIAKVSLEKFVHALNHARRRFPLVDANCHHEGTIATKAAHEFRRVYPVPASANRQAFATKAEEFYSKHCHLRLVFEDSTVVGGYCVLSGELLGMWNIRKGKGDWMMQHAINDGATHLDHFDVPALSGLYQRHGFVEVLREPNDPKQKPTGGPDVVFRRKQEK